MITNTMTLFACPKCGESYNVTPPDSDHKKPTKYPDRDTIPTSIECKMCGTLNTIYWKSIQ